MAQGLYSFWLDMLLITETSSRRIIADSYFVLSFVLAFRHPWGGSESEKSVRTVAASSPLNYIIDISCH